MRIVLVLFISFGFSASVTFAAGTGSGASSTAASAGVSNSGASRFDEIVMWKITDEMHLDADLEARFEETLRSLNIRKKSASEKLERALASLHDVQNSKKESERALARYRSSLSDVQRLQMSELDEIQKVLGPQKFASYLSLKADITAKLTQALIGAEPSSAGGTATPGGKGAGAAGPTPAAASSSGVKPLLPPPKLIEE